MAQPYDLTDAVAYLHCGGVICHACEGVWGIACDPFNAAAVERILDIKQRPQAKGLIVIASTAEVFAPELSSLTHRQLQSIYASWPGHTTWILPTTRFPAWVTGQHQSIAARVPAHDQSRDLCAKFGGPLISTSANLSGQPPHTTMKAVERQFNELVDYIQPGEIGSATGPSKILDAISEKQLR